QERVHPFWVVPGGVRSPLTVQARDRILAEVPRAHEIAARTMRFSQSVLEQYKDDIPRFGTFPTMYAGMVNAQGTLEFYEGAIRFKNASDEIVADQVSAESYRDYISEASVRHSYLKAPFDKPAHSSFLYHHARLIEVVHALECIEQLLADPSILNSHVRANAGVNSLDGVGMIEAPRGLLIHHYKVNEQGAIVWANLIVASGHNNQAIGRSVLQVAKEYVHGEKLEEGMLNRVSAVVRAYDPCLSCSTHAAGTISVRIQLLASDGRVLDEIRN